MNKNWIRALSLVAGISVLGAGAQALALPGQDATILIDRALNSPTLSVRYSGVNATMVELKINGTSFGTRAVESKNKRGETTFSIDLSQLADGDNEVEIRLFDKDGRLLGSQKSKITSDSGEKGPVYLVSPKVGGTVMGPVEIKVGFGKDLKNSYVSYFVNGQFKSLTNTAPYSFVWDSTREANGWHEIEAWVVDDSANTFKTRKVRVFVNNPGGPTKRPIETVAASNPPKAGGTTKAAPAKATAAAAAPVDPPANLVPGVTGAAAQNEVHATLGSRNSLKAVDGGAATAMGSRTMTPSITKAGVAPTKVAKAAPETIEIKVATPKVGAAANTAAKPVSISRGTRLPNIGNYSILLNNAPVLFDVQPRVQDGIPLTPFRALFEQAGGKVDWENLSKAVSASGMGKDVFIKIGDKLAKVNKIEVSMEIAPFIERGRTVVPLSFIRDSLDVNVEYDAATGHVLITKKN